MTHIRPALTLMILLTLCVGGIYPLLTTVLAQWWFPQQANGSLIEIQGAVRGSQLTGQAFTSEKYFHGRPSASAEVPYNSLASGGSNLAGSNPELDRQIRQRVATLRAANPQANPAVPVELVTASASGLDPAISPEAAAWQIPRIAQARGLPSQQLARLIAAQTQQPWAEFMGPPVVNVTALNLALDALHQP